MANRIHFHSITRRGFYAACLLTILLGIASRAGAHPVAQAKKIYCGLSNGRLRTALVSSRHVGQFGQHRVAMILHYYRACGSSVTYLDKVDITYTTELVRAMRRNSPYTGIFTNIYSDILVGEDTRQGLHFEIGNNYRTGGKKYGEFFLFHRDDSLIGFTRLGSSKAYTKRTVSIRRYADGPFTLRKLTAEAHPRDMQLVGVITAAVGGFWGLGSLGSLSVLSNDYLSYITSAIADSTNTWTYRDICTPSNYESGVCPIDHETILVGMVFDREDATYSWCGHKAQTAFGPVQHCYKTLASGLAFGNYSPVTQQFGRVLGPMHRVGSGNSPVQIPDVRSSDGSGRFEFEGGAIVQTPFGPTSYGEQRRSSQLRWGNYNFVTEQFYPESGTWLPNLGGCFGGFC